MWRCWHASTAPKPGDRRAPRSWCQHEREFPREEMPWLHTIFHVLSEGSPSLHCRLLPRRPTRRRRLDFACVVELAHPRRLLASCMSSSVSGACRRKVLACPQSCHPVQWDADTYVSPNFLCCVCNASWMYGMIRQSLVEF